MTKLQEELRTRALQLRDELAPYSATALVTAVLYHEVAMSRERKGRHRQGQLAITEHLALLLLPRIVEAAGSAPTPDIVHAAAERAYTMTDELHRAEIAAAINSDHKRLDETVAARFRIAGLTLRNPGVPEHWRELLEGFAQDFNPGIERWLPFSLGNALAIMEALQTGHRDRYSSWYNRWHETGERAWRAYRDGRIDEPAGGVDFGDLFAYIRSERLRPRKSIIKYVEACGLADIDSVAFIDCEDVSVRTGVSVDVVRAFLSLFSVDVNVREDLLILPSARNVLTRTPFIETRRGYFVPYLPLLQWAILPRIEDLLNPNSLNSFVKDVRGWRVYERQRSRFLEMTTAKILRNVAERPPEANISYRLAGSSTVYETDVRADLDTTSYIAECKSATLSDATRRGAELSLERDVRDLLEAAANQLARGITHFQAEDSAKNTEARREFIPMLVTLDHSGPISAGIRTPHFIGSAKGALAPWALSLLDLYTLHQLLETPWRFKHYARRRLLAAKEGRDTFAYDELDFYHNYLFLNTCAMPGGGTHFLLVAPTDDVDDYFNSLDPGTRRKPVPVVPEQIRSLIEDIERNRADGWSDVVCDLLDLSGSVTEMMVSTMARRKRSVASGGTAASLLRQPDQRFGLIYVATRERRLSDAIVMAQLQTSPMGETEETHLFIVHDPFSRRVLHRVFKRVGLAWSPSQQKALHLGEDGMLLSAT